MTNIADQTAQLDATELARLVANKEVNALDLVDAAIERLERVNGRLNAVITPMYEEARSKAAGHNGRGPFAGVPFLVKDFLAEVKGVRFTEALLINKTNAAIVLARPSSRRLRPVSRPTGARASRAP